MNGDRGNAELLVLLKNAWDDIERTKQMQWRDFYYVLIAIGAVTGLYTLVIDELTIQWMHHLFFIAPAALMVLGIWLVWATERTLTQRRELIELGYYPLLDQTIKNILTGPLGESLNRGLYPRLYTAVISITASFSITVMIGLRLSSP